MIAGEKLIPMSAKEEVLNEASLRQSDPRQDRLERAADIIHAALCCPATVSMESVVEALQREDISPSSLQTLGPDLTGRIERALNAGGSKGGAPVRSDECNALKSALECLLTRLAADLGIKSPTQQDRARHAAGARAKNGLVSAALAFLMVGVPSQGFAGMANNPFAGLSTVSDHELASSRGGFKVEGVDINFGAVVKTVVNGAVVLETQLTATNGGLVAVQTGPATTSSTPVPGSPQINVRVVDNTLVAEGTLVPGQKAPSVYASGVVITSPGGSSAAVSSFDPTRIVNAVSSTDSNQSISQQVEINVTLNNYTALRSQIQLSQLGTNVTNNVQSALATSISH